MLNLTENPKMDLTSSNEISTQKISVSDKSDSFVIDMESLSHGGSNKEINQNPRIVKSLSRKGSQRGDKKIITSNIPNSVNEKDSFVVTSPSPRGSSMAEKATTAADQTNNPQVHHQMSVTTGNITAATESRFNLRRIGSRRFSSPWALDPKRILLLFATLSSLGTILLIYFTLSIGKTNGVEDAFD